jgi:DNA-binding PadR family transcriptional regulator
MEKQSDRELKRGTLEMILLKMLDERPMYGYELVSTLEQRAGDEFQLKEGTLYPVLYRLENAGWIVSSWETQERGNPRKYYELTGDGASRLAILIRDWRDFSSAVDRLLDGKGDA